MFGGSILSTPGSPASSFFFGLQILQQSEKKQAASALPTCLDKLFDHYASFLCDVCAVFLEVITQAICTRYTGCILDCVLGHNEALFRRAQLKALVSIHSKEVKSLLTIQPETETPGDQVKQVTR